LSVNGYYELTLELLDKSIDTPTTIPTTGRVINGNLAPFKHRLELVNTGNSKTDNGVLTLRIPPDGTFIRTEPILIDEGAKDQYVIQAQIRQSDGAGGVSKGKIFRFTIGSPTIQDDVESGETLKMSLIPIEYRIKEHLTSKQLKFVSPKTAFETRLLDYNLTKGSLEPAVLYGTNINLPDDDENLKQNWEPRAPTKTWDLLREIIERLSLPAVAGGTFQDYFFEFESSSSTPFGGDITTGSINVVDAKAGKFGDVDSGIIIDPISIVSPVDAEKDKTIMTDLVAYKNNIIMEGSARGGTLPMDRARFNSKWQHGQNRPLWNSGTTYYNETDPDFGQSLVKVTGIALYSGKDFSRYFKYIGVNGSSTTDNPVGAGQTDWYEDFTIIPPFNPVGHYEAGELVYIDDGNITFYVLKNGNTHQQGENAPNFPNPKWGTTFFTIPTVQHEPFFSYTPWTSNYSTQRANLSDQSAPASGYVGVVPDWNFERANFDRVVSDDQFEQVSLKAVVRSQVDSTLIPAGEIVNGARFLINGTGAGDFAGLHPDGYTKNNRVVEWFQPPFTTGEWKYSKRSALFEDKEMVTDLNTGQMVGWNDAGAPNAWSVVWDPQTSNGATSSPFHAISNGSLVNGGVTGFGMVAGSTQIPAQAIRLTYDWNFIRDALNMSSRGAWWVQHMPIPFKGLSGQTIGQLYANSTLDTTNLDRDSKGNTGWNNGLDSEDLGRISALTMKVRLTIHGVIGQIIHEYANMPFKAWALDIFGRIWYSDFTVRRNGQYSFVRIQFGENAPQKLHHNRIDELFSALGFDFSQNFFLKEKQFTGIEFDWRFVKSFGIFWNVGYDDNGMYVGVREAFADTLSQWAHQIKNFTLSSLFNPLVPPKALVIDHVHLDIDELGFEKQLYANSDDVKVANARTEIANLGNESDYLNLKGRAQGVRARKKFINQEWHMAVHGDVRMRLGQKFKVTGSRVPEQAVNYTAWNIITNYNIGDKVSKDGFVWQSIRDGISRIPATNPSYWINLNETVCVEAKHIIDNDGYTMQIIGVRKFVFTA